MDEVTQILFDIENGDESRPDTLLPLIYDDLRNLASARIRKERVGQTLQATDLVHEAFVRLVGSTQSTSWNSRGHFFGAAAEAMRRIMVERARRKKRVRHGGEMHRIVDIELNDVAGVKSVPDDLLALDEALTRLEAKAPERAKLVKLRYFTGLTVPEAAQAMDISVSTAERYWRFARTWLFTEIRGTDDDSNVTEPNE